jgi:hypothetical protein
MCYRSLRANGRGGRGRSHVTDMPRVGPPLLSVELLSGHRHGSAQQLGAGLCNDRTAVAGAFPLLSITTAVVVVRAVLPPLAALGEASRRGVIG